MNFNSFKRCFSSKIWSYKQASQWQQSFTQQQIPKDHISISFSRSSGPGGQNVNKVSTKVDLRLNLSNVDWLPDYAKENIRNATRLKKSKNNELIVTSDKTRSQATNIQNCYDKLITIIKESVAVAKEADQVTLAKVEQLRKIEDHNRKQFKKKQSQKKSDRRSKGKDY